MNEQIRELAKQAGMVEYPTGIGVNENTIWGDRNISKFAELIVRECANIFAQEGTGRYQVDGNWIAKTIKQHFGVER